MSVEKLFEPLKNLDDSALSDYIEVAYSLFMKDFLSYNQISKVGKKFDSKLISNLVRFFRNLNITIKQDEDALKEILKGKSSSYESVLQKINEIFKHQGSRKYFSDAITAGDLSKNFFCHDPARETYISSLKVVKELSNLTWKVNLVVCNSDSSRILVPEIILGFTFTDGTSKKAHISMKVFQELRKNLTFHIKRIIENEHVALLK